MPRVPPFDRPATYDDLSKVPDIQVAESWKLGIYAREGIGHAWLVDPDARTRLAGSRGGHSRGGHLDHHC